MITYEIKINVTGKHKKMPQVSKVDQFRFFFMYLIFRRDHRRDKNNCHWDAKKAIPYCHVNLDHANSSQHPTISRHKILSCHFITTILSRHFIMPLYHITPLYHEHFVMPLYHVTPFYITKISSHHFITTILSRHFITPSHQMDIIANSIIFLRMKKIWWIQLAADTTILSPGAFKESVAWWISLSTEDMGNTYLSSDVKIVCLFTYHK